MFITNKEELTFEDIIKYAEKWDNTKFKTLLNYYKGIVTKGLNNAYPKFIVDMLAGYLLGSPVSYDSEDKNLIDKINPIFKLNDEQYHNAEIAKTMGICGVAFELNYLDENGLQRFTEISPTEMFIVFDNTLQKNIKYAVRLYTIEKTTYLEIYDSEKVTRYAGKDLKNLILQDEQPHYFGEVPVVVFYNNKEEQGDFEQVLQLIDAYNLVQKNTLEDMKDFTDAFLVLVNMLDTDKTDVEKAKKDKTLLLDSDGKAEWLIKNVNDSWVENYKQRLKKDIHKFSMTPDLTDESFGSNLSGVSIKYKILAMEQLRKIKERQFKKGLQRRIRLMSNILNIKGGVDGTADININFSVSLPQNVVELSQVINNLASFISTDTLINQLPFIEDSEAEMSKKEKESKKQLDSYGLNDDE